MLSLGVLAAAFYCKKRKGVMTKLDVRERRGGGEEGRRGDALSWRPRRCLLLQDMERCHDEITGALLSSVRPPLVHGVCGSEGE